MSAKCQERFRNLFDQLIGAGRTGAAGRFLASVVDQTAGRDKRNNLKLALRCASDSYNVDFRGTAINSGGNMTGNWFESTNQAAGQFFGSIKGNRIDARIEGQTFAAFFNMTTYGNRQSVSLRSPGSRVSSVTMALTRR